MVKTKGTDISEFLQENNSASCCLGVLWWPAHAQSRSASLQAVLKGASHGLKCIELHDNTEEIGGTFPLLSPFWCEFTPEKRLELHLGAHETQNSVVWHWPKLNTREECMTEEAWTYIFETDIAKRSAWLQFKSLEDIPSPVPVFGVSSFPPQVHQRLYCLWPQQVILCT
jgi:hypothetical protein